MQQELLVKWLEALRSGEIKQGIDALCYSDGSMCCLGVLVKVAGFEFIVDEDDEEAWPLSVKGMTSENNMPVSEFPPTAWMQEIGLDYKFAQELAGDNDSEGMTFAEIADKIEKRYKK
jgi:hypothetical protein